MVLDISLNGLGYLPRQRKNERSDLMFCSFAILTIQREAHIKDTIE